MNTCGMMDTQRSGAPGHLMHMMVRLSAIWCNMMVRLSATWCNMMVKLSATWILVVWWMTQRSGAPGHLMQHDGKAFCHMKRRTQRLTHNVTSYVSSEKYKSLMSWRNMMVRLFATWNGGHSAWPTMLQVMSPRRSTEVWWADNDPTPHTQPTLNDTSLEHSVSLWRQQQSLSLDTKHIHITFSFLNLQSDIIVLLTTYS
jgi:hypothetical protein